MAKILKSELKKLISKIVMDIVPGYVKQQISEAKNDILLTLLTERANIPTKSTQSISELFTNRPVGGYSDMDMPKTVSNLEPMSVGGDEMVSGKGILEWIKHRDTGPNQQASEFNYTEDEILDFVSKTLDKSLL